MGGLSVPLVLLAGVVSFASPCFLPVVPVYIGYVTGDGAASRTGGRAAAVRQALCFVAAFSLVFIALWTLVGLIGWAVGDYRDVLRIAGGAVLILLGLNTAGLIHLPFLDRTLRPGGPTAARRDASSAASTALARPGASAASSAPAGPSSAPAGPSSATAPVPPAYRRSFLLGLAFGAGWTPCIGPVLGGVLGLATSGSLATGVGLLAVYSLGLGLPFVAVAAGATSLTRRLSWFARHARGVGIVTGTFLMALGFGMITDLLTRLASFGAAL